MKPNLKKVRTVNLDDDYYYLKKEKYQSVEESDRMIEAIEVHPISCHFYIYAAVRTR